MHRYLQGGPAWGNSIANTPANTSASSSTCGSDASGAGASNSGLSPSRSGAPKLPLPPLSNSTGCAVTVEGEGGHGSGAEHRRASSSIGGLRDLMQGVGESRGRLGSFCSSTLGASGNLWGKGVPQPGGDESEKVRSASEGTPKGDKGVFPGVLAASGRMTNLSET